MNEREEENIGTSYYYYYYYYYYYFCKCALLKWGKTFQNMFSFVRTKSLHFIHTHLLSSLSYDRSKVFSKASSPHSAILSFLLQMRVSSPFLKVIQELSTSSSLSFCHFYPPLIFPSVTRCRRHFLLKMWPIQLAFRFLISYRKLLCSLTLSNTSPDVEGN
jgi:hypothetical protein